MAWQKTRASEGSLRVMRRADGPAEGDDSRETSTAVALTATDLTGSVRTSCVYQVQRRRETIRDHVLHENRDLENQEMSLKDYEANGIGDEEEDDDDELEDDDDDESEEHLSEEIMTPRSQPHSVS